MHKSVMGAILALSFAALSYAALVIFGGWQATAAAKAPPAHAAVQRSAEEIAARDRMAQIVAQVAARTAARTAKSVTLNRLSAQAQPRQPMQVAEQAVAQTTAVR